MRRWVLGAVGAWLLMLHTLVGGGCLSMVRVAPGETLAPPGETVLPATMCGDAFLVSARINDRGPYTLLVDTGAASVVLTPDVAAEMQDRIGRTFVPAVGATGRRVPVTQRVRVDELAVGELRLRGFNALVMDLKGFETALGGDLDGILGYPAFRDLLLVLDYPAGQVRIARGALSPGDSDVLRTRGRQTPQVPVRLQGRTLDVVVDSGSSGDLMLRWRGALEYKVQPRVVGTVLAIGGTDVRKVGRAAGEAVIAGRSFVEPFIEPSRHTSLVGTQLLREFRVTFDQRSGLARFESRTAEPVTFPSLYGIGIGTSPESGALRVVEVFTGMPAERAGIRVGDVVESANDVAITDLFCMRQRLFNKPETAILGIRRGEERLQIAVQVVTLVP
jgi:hypothetical protein